MSKPTQRATSRYALEAARLLGQLIRIGRIERKITTADLAARAGISRALLYRIERGDLGCSVGATFETAAIVGVPLFAPDANAVSAQVTAGGERLSLLPKSVRGTAKVFTDDF